MALIVEMKILYSTFYIIPASDLLLGPETLVIPEKWKYLDGLLHIFICKNKKISNMKMFIVCINIASLA